MQPHIAQDAEATQPNAASVAEPVAKKEDQKESRITAGTIDLKQIDNAFDQILNNH